jgi:hypothetical protein
VMFTVCGQGPSLHAEGLSMLHHPEVTLHTIMCLAIGTCLWVGDAGSA